MAETTHGPSLISTADAVVAEASSAVSARLVQAMERIADALEQIARQQTSAPVETGNPASNFPAFRSDAASTNHDDQMPSSPVALVSTPVDKIASMEAQLTEIRDLLRRQVKLAHTAERKFYAVEEVAEQTCLSKWTIRNACSIGRIKADKSPDGKWRISHEELLKIQNEGLPPEHRETVSP